MSIGHIAKCYINGELAGNVKAFTVREKRLHRKKRLHKKFKQQRDRFNHFIDCLTRLPPISFSMHYDPAPAVMFEFLSALRDAQKQEDTQ